RTLEVPCPIASRVFEDVVSVILSTSWAVINDSNSPTTAIASAAGKMIRKVSIVNGTSGSAKIGSSLGSSPLSATVGTLIVKIISMNVKTKITTTRPGIVTANLSQKKINTRPSTNSKYKAHGTSIRPGRLAIKIQIASE